MVIDRIWAAGAFHKLGAPVKGFGWLIYGRFRADPYENYLAVSINLGVLSWGVPPNESPRP